MGKRTPTRPRLGVSRCVPSVCGSACTACCIRSARRSPSCSCARFRAPGQTRRPAAAHQAQACLARAAAAVRDFALQAGAAGPLPAARRVLDPTRKALALACPHSAPFSLAARGQSGACCTLLHLLFHRARHAPAQQCKQTAANRNSSNQFLAVLLPVSTDVQH